MKLLFISDIHGNSNYMNIMLNNIKNENPDKIIILGDLYSHGYNESNEVIDILNGLKDKILVIRGNCDRQIDEMISEFKFYDYYTLKYNNKSIYLTHGHIYNMNNLPSISFDIMIHGHFHIPYIKELNGKIYASPGSISKPRNNSKNSYMIIENNEIILKDLDGSIIENMQI